ncbi:hypothetical protein TUM19329_01940 [Legionella antarctica]|uniref:DUF4254 domain-containing protein n=1 Tax=Legionella antarctica TaxID=2708020 RepID=A0A6F8T0T4_9GAMM|nr:DUF4254 domain-containing protein [Legionella antarctica]BCA93833.1 hypothetical protein TUM19329_01940 [Legionella antarctica]
MQQLIDPSIITVLHKQCIVQWKSLGIKYQHQEFYLLAEENHAFNFQLWHAEDRARRDDMGYEFVYQAKREIDTCNQLRNNRMEAMDEWLFNTLHPEKPGQCPVNSESPGMIIDRLSILSLKSYHMALQTKRMDVSAEHRKNCAYKLEVIQQQLEQLSDCLRQLLDEIDAKSRTFRIYHQFKMYNDPTLNPELYSQ